jgi:hypothetical protein
MNELKIGMLLTLLVSFFEEGVRKIKAVPAIVIGITDQTDGPPLVNLAFFDSKRSNALFGAGWRDVFDRALSVVADFHPDFIRGKVKHAYSLMTPPCCAEVVEFEKTEYSLALQQLQEPVESPQALSGEDAGQLAQLSGTGGLAGNPESFTPAPEGTPQPEEQKEEAVA